jgi:nucleoside-diphosphate-sugar epimerase
MDRPLIIVYGDRGFLGKNLVRHFSSKSFEVLGIGRNEMCLHKDGSSIILSGEVKEFNRIISRFAGNHIFINCIRDNKLHFNDVDLLRMHGFSRYAAQVINFSTYIQHYESNYNSSLKLYRENQLRKSLFLSENIANEKLLDISLFTLYGHGDPTASFLSSITKDMIEGKPLLLTKLDQLVSYTWVEDVCELVDSLIAERTSRFGIFSFWQTPLLRLEEYFDALMNMTGSTSEVRKGNLPYKGHELFRYEDDLFPVQISPHFLFTPFEDGFKFLIS